MRRMRMRQPRHALEAKRMSLLGFKPTTIAGCATWLDGADSTTITQSSSNVTAWADKSGAGNNFTTTTTVKPTVGTANGLSAISFPATDATMVSAVATTMTPTSSVFLVCQVTAISNLSTPANGMMDYAFSCNSIEGGDFSIRLTSGGLQGTYGNGGNGNDLGYGYYWVNGTNATTTSISSATYSNLTLIDTAGVNITTNTGTLFSLSPNGASLGRYFIGTVAEVVVYTSTLTGSQRQQVEGYLAWKWGMQALLPPSHPYSTANYTACFLAGTRIRTPLREVPVERLDVGHEVETSDGRAVPIHAVWYRRTRIDDDPWLLEPCVIRRGTLGATRDLFLSPRHGVFLGEELRAVGSLPWAERSGHRGWVDYYHLQLPSPHDDLVANGVRCESFRARRDPFL
jgi:hypothetical protein